MGWSEGTIEGVWRIMGKTLRNYQYYKGGKKTREKQSHSRSSMTIRFLRGYIECTKD
jgi:hypothetical protein